MLLHAWKYSYQLLEPLGQNKNSETWKLGNQTEFVLRVCVYEFVSSSLFVSVRLWESNSFRVRAHPLGKPRLHPCPVNSSLPQHFMVMGFKTLPT